MKLFNFLLGAGLLIGFTSCEKDPLTQPKIDATTAELLVSGDLKSTDFTLFSFADGKSLPSSERQSEKWDFGLTGVTFAFNSGSSGPGKAGVIIVQDVFDNILEAPESGYLVDKSVSEPAVLGTSWFNYSQTQFSPKAGVVFLVKTAKGNYAKMEVLKADPTDDTGKIVIPQTRPTKFKYTIRYVHQPDGRRYFTK